MDMTCAKHTCWGSVQNQREGPNQVTYQIGSKSMKLLPLTGAAKGLFTKSATNTVEPKGKRKADGPTVRQQVLIPLPVDFLSDYLKVISRFFRGRSACALR